MLSGDAQKVTAAMLVAVFFIIVAVNLGCSLIALSAILQDSQHTNFLLPLSVALRTLTSRKDMNILADLIRIGSHESNLVIDSNGFSVRAPSISFASVSSRSSSSSSISSLSKSGSIGENIEDLKDETLKSEFVIKENSISLNTPKVTIKGLASATTMQTPKINSGPGNDLKLKSRTGAIFLEGPSKANLRSFGGDVKIQGLKGVHLSSPNGEIRLQTSGLVLPDLEISKPTLNQTNLRKFVNLESKAYQLCVCKEGKVFAAEPHLDCIADYHVCGK